jgi:hypothetical protein
MNAFRKKAPPPAPAWHPDFRDPANLPDVKPVRTAFFVNGAAVLVMAIAALFLAFKEYGRHNLRADIQVLEQTLRENGTRNNQVLGLNRSFQAEERYILEVADYLDKSVEVSELLMALSETLHPSMAFSLIRYQDVTERGQVVGRQLVLNGAIRATPDEAASAITDYLNIFHQQPFLMGLVAEAIPTSLVPAPEGDRMAFGIQLTLKGSDEEKKGDKK